MVEVLPSGRKTIKYRYTSIGGYNVIRSIGEWGVITLAEAEEKCRTLINSHKRGEFVSKAPDISFAQACEKALTWYSSVNNVKPKTVETHRKRLRENSISQLGNKKLSEINEKDIHNICKS
ncbi:putative site-specific recombinase, phage integrase family [Campylobacter sp. RM16192]|nr:Arm DNA-binding domain-containing protein [Campylobacter sp. RM16192]QCD52232.1 putative site-specific recombinase, phage integrase family [Campylobacter sp. RM16192]